MDSSKLGTFLFRVAKISLVVWDMFCVKAAMVFSDMIGLFLY